MTDPTRWAVEWYSRCKLDGEQRYFMWDGSNPALFVTRSQCRAHIKERYGYIKHRPDLRTEPHGWHLPRAVRVRVRLERI